MYLVFSKLLKSFDREDLETLWRLVKAKHGYTRPEDGYERVLWGDLKVMFEPHVEDAVWRNLQGNKVLVWKLFDSYGVHFVRFSNLHIYMLITTAERVSTVRERVNTEERIKIDQDYLRDKNEFLGRLLESLIRALDIPKWLNNFFRKVITTLASFVGRA
ncbi:hypothetical protein Tco_0558389 [Tanacetum coccineum]